MSEIFRCDDKETFVAYLYGEIDAECRREVERHLRTCAACAREADALQRVRQDLASWEPAIPDLGFEIQPRAAAIVRPSRWAALNALPRWAQVAAALLLVAASAAIANVQVEYGTQGLSVRTGWMAAPATMTVAPASPAAADWRPALAALEQSLRREMQEARQTTGSAVRVRAEAPADTAAVLRQMQALVNASESRQRDEMARRLAQTYRDWDIQRRGDIVRIEQRIGTLQGRTFKAEAGQQEVMNLLRRVSAQPIP
jgi:anti-sigma factor RsiW